MNDTAIPLNPTDMEAKATLAKVQRANAEEYDRLLRRICTEMGKQTDNFLHECMRRIFPDFVPTFIVDYRTVPAVNEAAAELKVATRLRIEEGALPRETGARVRQVFVGPDRRLVGILSITYADGSLKFERSFDDTMVPTRPLFTPAHYCVRLFLWRLCSITQCARPARLRYGIFYGCGPESSAENIPGAGLDESAKADSRN